MNGKIRILADPKLWFFIAAFYIGFLFLFSLGGWRRLAKRYGSFNEPRGKVCNPSAAMMGFTRYLCGLTIYASQEGLYFKASLFLRLFHPPLFIPWSALHPFREFQTARTSWTWVQMTVGEKAIATVSLPREIYHLNPFLK